jgi:hypothetical protein
MFWLLKMIVTLIFHGICSLSQQGRICGGKSCHHQASGSNSVLNLSVLIIFGYLVSLRDSQVSPSSSLNTLTLTEPILPSDNDGVTRIASPTLEDALDSIEGSDLGLDPWKGKKNASLRGNTEDGLQKRRKLDM